MRASFPGVGGGNRKTRRDDPAAAGLVDDVNTIVLAVRPCDTEKEGEPAPEAQPPLLREPVREDELVPAPHEISPFLLPDPVQEHLVAIPDSGRKSYARLGHLHRMPDISSCGLRS